MFVYLLLMASLWLHSFFRVNLYDSEKGFSENLISTSHGNCCEGYSGSNVYAN